MGLMVLLGFICLASAAKPVKPAKPDVAAKMKQCQRLHNGCSVPGIGNKLSDNLKKYHAIFKPVCNRHDICYSCGEFNRWNQQACDKAFLKNMHSICHLRYNTRRRYTWWQQVQIALSMGYDMTAWLNIPDDTLEHCLHGASIFYKGVDGFGHDRYGAKKGYRRVCRRCAKLGKP